MRRKLLLRVMPLCFLLPVALAVETRGLSLERTQPPASSLPRLWVRSLSGATDHITVGRTVPGSDPSEAALPVSSGEWTEVVRSAIQEELRVGSGRDLLLVNASPRFDITAAEIGPGPSRVVAASPDVLRSNQQASLTVFRTRGPLPVALVLGAQKSSAEVQLRSGGKLLGFVNVASEMPTSVELDLRSLVDRLGRQPVQVEVRALRGEVFATSSLGRFLRTVTLKSFGGYASFNYTANWQQTPDLYYYITSAPTSTCGELDTYRNGSWLYSSNWVCTDGSGNATKGPWSWSSTPSDQTDDPVYIRWPDGSATPSLTHYWDKTCPTITRTSPDGAPPGTYYGTASDTQWGACFSASWSSYVYSFFHDQTANLDWDPSARGYSSSSPVVVYGSLSGMPSCGVSWSTNFPALGAHTSGHSYLWETCIVESSDGCTVCTNLTFTY